MRWPSKLRVAYWSIGRGSAEVDILLQAENELGIEQDLTETSTGRQEYIPSDLALPNREIKSEMCLEKGRFGEIEIKPQTEGQPQAGKEEIHGDQG